jgi:hypothetical protein
MSVTTIAPYTECRFTGAAAAVDNTHGTKFTEQLPYCQKNKTPFPITWVINL